MNRAMAVPDAELREPMPAVDAAFEQEVATLCRVAPPGRRKRHVNRKAAAAPG